MATSTTTKAARKAAREATLAAQAELMRRTQQNTDSLTVFFGAQLRADAVAEALEKKVAAIRAGAERQHREHLQAAGRALAEMRDRGESIGQIAALAGTSMKQVRDLIRMGEAESPAGQAAAGSLDESEPESDSGVVTVERGGS